MDPVIGSTLLGVGGSLVSSGLNQLFNKGSSNKAYQRQKNLMALEQQYARANWQMENAYNSPVAQMERLRAAGLNPDLIYGHGAAGLQGGTVGDPGTGSAPVQAPANFDLLSNVGAGMQLELASKDLERKDQDIERAKLENEDLRQDLAAKSKEYKNEGDADFKFTLDGDGKFITVPTSANPPATNYWQEKRAMHRQQLNSMELDNDSKKHYLSILIDSEPWLRNMSLYQLKNLQADVESKEIANKIANGELDLYERYGINKDDKNAVTSLLRIALRDPDAFSRILDGLIDAFGRTGKHSIELMKKYLE